MKKNKIKRTRKIAMLLSAALLIEQPAIINPVLYVHAEEETSVSSKSEETITEIQEVDSNTDIDLEIDSVEIESMDADNENSTEENITVEESIEIETENSFDENTFLTAEELFESYESTIVEENIMVQDTKIDVLETEADSSSDDVTKRFVDIPAGEWYVSAAQFVFDEKIMNGVSETYFAPQMTLTREQFITVLYNMEGAPKTTFKKIFEDVTDETCWFAKSVTWASENDITSGIGENKFGVGMEITREQLATLLYNYSQQKYKNAMSTNDKAVVDFPDAAQISTWASDGMKWAVSNKVMNGKAGNDGKNYLDPGGKASRAECAQMIKNYIDAITNSEKDDSDSHIRHMDTSLNESTEEIGQIYFKELSSIDDLFNNVDGLQCVRNQLLISAKEGVSFDQILNLLSEVNADIVGYIELTNDYQIELKDNVNPENLEEIRLDLEKSELINRIDYNYASKVVGNFHSDEESKGVKASSWTSGNDWADDSKDGFNDEWTDQSPVGNNWGLETINFTGALIKANVIKSESDTAKNITDPLSEVKIGIIDTGFCYNHHDLDFAHIWNNPIEWVNDGSGISYNQWGHGTEMAGIIGAKFNNGFGVCGVSVKSKLYGFGLAGGMDSKVQSFCPQFTLKSALVTLVANNVKVINYSQGYEGVALNIAANINKNVYEDLLKKSTNGIEDTLQKLMDKGYDFLIVTSAGNDNNSSVNGINISNVQAKYNNEFTYSEKFKDRIVCVGAITKNAYSEDPNSAVGDRVDILAPGESIFSTVEDGNYSDRIIVARDNNTSQIAISPNSGTSPATAFVSGAAGLAYSVNPGISATYLKDILVKSSNRKLSGNAPLLDVEKVVSKAGNGINSTQPERGAIIGTVSELDMNNNSPIALENVRIEIRFKKDGAIYDVSYTDEDGFYSFTLPEGNYYLKYLKDGYNEVELSNVYISKGNYTRRDIEMENINIAQLSLTVVNSNGKPVSGADIKIYHMDACYANVMGGMKWECSDPDAYILNAKSDKNGKVSCYLPTKTENYNGCYVILADKNNKIGNSISIGRMEWPRCLFYDGMEKDNNIERTIKLLSYSDTSDDKTVEIQTCNIEGDILYSSKVSFYKGWNLKALNKPTYQFTAPAAGAWWGEILRVNVPKGRYTLKVENGGYQAKCIEILVTDNNNAYKVTVQE